MPTITERLTPGLGIRLIDPAYFDRSLPMVSDPILGEMARRYSDMTVAERSVIAKAVELKMAEVRAIDEVKISDGVARGDEYATVGVMRGLMVKPDYGVSFSDAYLRRVVGASRVGFVSQFSRFTPSSFLNTGAFSRMFTQGSSITRLSGSASVFAGTGGYGGSGLKTEDYLDLKTLGYEPSVPQGSQPVLPTIPPYTFSPYGVPEDIFFKPVYQPVFNVSRFTPTEEIKTERKRWRVPGPGQFAFEWYNTNPVPTVESVFGKGGGDVAAALKKISKPIKIDVPSLNF